MQRNCEIRFRDLRVKSVGQHRFSAVDRFFRRLSDQNQCAAPLLLQLCEHLRRAQHVRNVNVVATSVHHAYILTSIVLRLDCARVGQAGLFFRRQRVKIGAHQNRWPVAVLHDGDHAIAFPIRLDEFSYVLCHLVTERAQLRGEER